MQAALKRDGSFSTCMCISCYLIGLSKHEGCCEAAVGWGGRMRGVCVCVCVCMSVCVWERERESVKSDNLLWLLSMLTIIGHFWAIRLCSCRTWGGTDRHCLIHLWESEQQREIKWVLIRTVWDLRWLHLNQFKKSSGKSTPCFQPAYTFYSGGGILEAFFNHIFPVWFILINSRKFISQDEFSLTGISFHSLWILMTSECWWDVIC